MQTSQKYIYRFTLIVSIFILFSNVSFAQKAALGKEKKHYEALNIFPDSIVVREDGMRTTGKRGTFEWWYFDAHLDDGLKVVIVFFTKPTHLNYQKTVYFPLGIFQQNLMKNLQSKNMIHGKPAHLYPHHKQPGFHSLQ